MSDGASFRLAYDEAVRAVRAQADTLGGLRQRAGTVLATSVVVTAFFGGQAVARGAAPSSMGWLAVVAFAITGALSVAVLFPADTALTTDVEEVVALVERAPSEREPRREVSLMLWGRYRANTAAASRACSGSSASRPSGCSSRRCSGSSSSRRRSPTNRSTRTRSPCSAGSV